MGREKDDTTGIKHGKPDLIRIGMFSEPLYISSGEAYTSKKGTSLEWRTNLADPLLMPLVLSCLMIAAVSLIFPARLCTLYTSLFS